MDKDKGVRKKSTSSTANSHSNHSSHIDADCRLPTPPPDPRGGDCGDGNVAQPPPMFDELPEAFRRIAGFGDRQDAFLRSLASTIRTEMDGAGHTDEFGGTAAATTTPSARSSAGAALSAECDDYIKPLLERTGPSISAALVTEGAIDQLDKLHGILEQLLDMQAQNYRLRRNTRDVETLIALKKSRLRVSDAHFAVTVFPVDSSLLFPAALRRDSARKQ